LDPEKNKNAGRLYNALRKLLPGRLMNYGAGTEEATEIYHNAFTIYLKALNEGKKIRHHSAYIAKICFFLLGDLVEEKTRWEILEADPDRFISPEEEEVLEHAKELFNRYSSLLSQKCREIFEYLKQGYSWKVIAKRMGLKDHKKASDDGRYCMRVLRDIIATQELIAKNKKNKKP
jgi:predicted DNA-binding protein YlxM (UPF0122 family)